MANCESCGRQEPDTIKVQRMYLVAGDDPDTDPTPLEPSDSPTPGEIENWCASCCASFPHVVVITE
ncbi:MAG: hypothetical protein H6517_03710 [Microthrixaceae bacterium]|nr:hypothetical protein [Microthrixaceae bacterium]